MGLLGVHLGLDLLAHGAAQQVGAAQAVARHLLGDLHHLFLVDDDALRLVEDVVDGGVQRLARLERPFLTSQYFGMFSIGPGR